MYPIEIENRLEAHPDVAEVAVIGVDDEVLGQEVKAVVVPMPGATLDPEQLARVLRRGARVLQGAGALGDPRPSRCRATRSGKVVKAVLTEPDAMQFAEE